MKRMLVLIAVVLGSGFAVGRAADPAFAHRRSIATAADSASESCLYSGDRARLARSFAVLEVEVVGNRTPPADPRTLLFLEAQPIRVIAGVLPHKPFMLRIGVEPPLSACEFALDTPRYMVLAIERSAEHKDWEFETSTRLVLFGGPELAGPDYLAARSEIEAALPTPPDAGTGLVVLAGTERDIPWDQVVMAAILLMSFAGATVAIVRSSRRRR